MSGKGTAEEMATECTIRNAIRCRDFGYGVSTTPSGRGTDIAPPSGPDYTGTLGQIEKQMRDDLPYLQSIQTAFQARRWFHRGRPIRSVWTYGWLQALDDGQSIYGQGWFRVQKLYELREAIAKDGTLRIRYER